MNNKPVARTSSSVTLAIAIALSQLVASNVAQADSVHEWGYWDAATAAGPSSGGDAGINNITVQNFNTAQNTTSGQNIPTDQRVIGIDNGQFVTANAADTGGYVGYTLCYYNCNGGSGYYNATSAGNVNIDVTQGAERVADRGHYEDTYNYYWNDITYKYVNETNHYDGNLAITGTFNGSAFNLNDNAPDLVKQTYTYYENGSQYYNYSYTNINSQTDNTSFSAYTSMNNGVNSPVNRGSISADNSFGWVLFGKPVAATQVAEQMRLGQTYNFSGGSQMGSYVQLAVNFQNATWNGTWSEVNRYNYETRQVESLHNGFAAAGGISGSTLASNSVTGAGAAGVGFVTGGKVDATLVGVIKGTDASAAAVIGKTVITVQQAVGTKAMGDVFSATSGLGCKGCDS